MVDDLAWADASPGAGPTLDEIYCLTFIKAVDESEGVAQDGRLPDTIATRALADIGKLHNFDNGYPTVASALPLGAWTVVFEPNGFEGSHLLAALSNGTEAISLLRHDYATTRSATRSPASWSPTSTRSCLPTATAPTRPAARADDRGRLTLSDDGRTTTTPSRGAYGSSSGSPACCPRSTLTGPLVSRTSSPGSAKHANRRPAARAMTARSTPLPRCGDSPSCTT